MNNLSVSCDSGKLLVLPIYLSRQCFTLPSQNEHKVNIIVMTAWNQFIHEPLPYRKKNPKIEYGNQTLSSKKPHGRDPQRNTEETKIQTTWGFVFSVRFLCRPLLL
jgi:hypothetical protein